MTTNLKNLGIEVQSDLLKAFSWDYEFLYLSTPGNICDLSIEADIQRTSLPRRIIIGQENFQEDFQESVYAYTKPLRKPQDQESILEVYDAWISFLLKRRGREGLSLSLFFENLPATEQSWQTIGETKPSYLEKIEVFDKDASFLRNTMQERCKEINLWRHISLEEFLKHVQRQGVIYYQQCTYGDPFFAYLCSVNPTNLRFQAQYLLRQIVEMALCQVIIIDERVAQIVNVKSQQHFARTLAWMGIWVVGRVEFKSNGNFVKIQEEGQEKDAIFTIGAEPNSQNGLITLIMNYSTNSSKFETEVKYPNGLQDFPEKPSKIEILTVHQTILDSKFQKPLKILLGNELWKENWILKLKPQVLFVYSHSGRGHPQELLPKNAPFLEYSFLQTHILNQPSKFFFVQSALVIKEPRR